MNLGEYAPVCAAGDVSLTIRDWTDNQGSTVVAANATDNITAATCYVCDSTGSSTCATSDAVSSGKGVLSVASSAATFTMKQNTDFAATYLEIGSARFEPLTMGA